MHYVYVYYDKDTRTPFYIGRGQGNRVFSHEKGSHNDAVAERIAQGSYGVDFLAHGLDLEGAQKVEAAAIDLMGIDNLTNKTRGTDSRTFGRIDVDDLLRSVAAETLLQADHDILLVSIRNTFEQYGRDPAALYDSTRGGWIIHESKRDLIKFVAGVVSKTIVCIYEVAAHFPAGTTRYTFREQLEKSDANRTEFVGREASDDIQDRYVGKVVEGKGRFQSPAYLGPTFDYTKFVNGKWTS